MQHPLAFVSFSADGSWRASGVKQLEMPAQAGRSGRLQGHLERGRTFPPAVSISERRVRLQQARREFRESRALGLVRAFQGQLGV